MGVQGVHGPPNSEQGRTRSEKNDNKKQKCFSFQRRLSRSGVLNLLLTTSYFCVFQIMKIYQPKYRSIFTACTVLYLLYCTYCAVLILLYLLFCTFCIILYLLYLFLFNGWHYNLSCTIHYFCISQGKTSCQVCLFWAKLWKAITRKPFVRLSWIFLWKYILANSIRHLQERFWRSTSRPRSTRWACQV
jgi:hypothetical protein